MATTTMLAGKQLIQEGQQRKHSRIPGSPCAAGAQDNTSPPQERAVLHCHAMLHGGQPRPAAPAGPE